MRLCFLLGVHTVATFARLLHSLPEDTYAFPKFRVAFLNGLPLLNETAERWLKEGLHGGEQEFLDQPWKDDNWNPPSHRKEIGSGHPTDQKPIVVIPDSTPLVTTNYTLELMKMGPRDSYLCLIPKPLDTVPSVHDDDSNTDVTPARSWSLLQPLSGTCLYHRQGWFTYSYCHNDEIRQFKELTPSQTRFTGTYKPEEDPEWESYTLGRAPPSPEPGVDLTLAEQSAQAANLELARTAGSRYLVQRWSDGTICDKTGKGREVEVQFHCSMVMTDHILFVKETKTCSYVLVIHTPRLCGEPGFKSRRDAGEEAQIRCREVVDTKPAGQLHLPTADHPLKVSPRKTVLPAPKPVAKGEKGEAASNKEKLFNDLLRKTLEALVATKGGGADPKTDDESELVIEVVEDLEDMGADGDRLVDALRAAGYDVRAEVVMLKGDTGKDEKREGKRQQHASGKKKPPADRDEL